MSTSTFPIVLLREASWSTDSVLVFDAHNTAPYMVNLYVCFLGESREVRVRTKAFPGWPARIALPLAVATGKTLFLKRTPGRFKTTVMGANLEVKDIREIRIIPSEGAEEVLEVCDVHLADAMPDVFPMPAEELVDDLHQWRSRPWPGKAASLAQVQEELRQEQAGPTPIFPGHWSAYGGWREQAFPASGFFRTEHDGKRWWLVDPDGYAFWSMGVDCVRQGNDVNVTGIKSVFDPPLPGADTHPHLWDGRDLRINTFDAGAHNWERVLGPGWKELWYGLTRDRLVRSRFNTIANWSDRELQRRGRLPYVFTMDGWPGTEAMLFRDFPDVYAAEYESNCARFARQLGALDR